MKKIIFILCFLLPLQVIAYTHTPYAVVRCGNPEVIRNDKPDTLYDAQFWIWPDGCASGVAQPQNEHIRCFYKCHRYNNTDIDCWHKSEQQGEEKIKIRDSYLVSYDIYRTAEQSIIKEETNIKLSKLHPCEINTFVSAEPVYIYKNVSIHGAELPEE